EGPPKERPHAKVKYHYTVPAEIVRRLVAAMAPQPATHGGSRQQDLVLQYVAKTYDVPLPFDADRIIEAVQHVETRDIISKAGNLMAADGHGVPLRDVWLRALCRRDTSK